MAKKNFDMGKLSLQGKKPIAKAAPEEVVEDKIETAIQEIHKEEEPVPAVVEPVATKPVATRTKKKTASKVKEALAEEPIKRITFDIPASAHMEIKLFCVRNDIPLKEFLLDAVLKEMKRKQ